MKDIKLWKSIQCGPGHLGTNERLLITETRKDAYRMTLINGQTNFSKVDFSSLKLCSFFSVLSWAELYTQIENEDAANLITQPYVIKSPEKIGQISSSP